MLTVTLSLANKCSEPQIALLFALARDLGQRDECGTQAVGQRSQVNGTISHKVEVINPSPPAHPANERDAGTGAEIDFATAPGLDLP